MKKRYFIEHRLPGRAWYRHSMDYATRADAEEIAKVLEASSPEAIFRTGEDPAPVAPKRGRNG